MSLEDLLLQIADGRPLNGGQREQLRIEVRGLTSARAGDAARGPASTQRISTLQVVGDLDVPAGSVRIGPVAPNKGNVLIRSGGIQLRQNLTVKIDLQSDGDIFVGTDTSAAATTNLAIFTVAQTYNSESVDSGDALFGDNSTSKANLYWDKSAGTLAFRSGTSARITIGTDGIMTLADALNISINNSTTNAVDNVFNITHNSTGTVANGFGSGILFKAEIGADGTTQNQSYIQSLWSDGTDGGARLILSVYNTSHVAQEGLRLDTSAGGAAMLGFYGVTAIVKPSSTTDLRTALINLGLYTTGGATPLNLNGGALTADHITDSNLTSGRVVYAGASGLLASDADLTFDGTDLTVGGTVNVGSVGTWTPAWTGTGTAGTFTYSNQSGNYTQIGGMVFFSGRMTITAIGTPPTTNMTITGLPVTSSSSKQRGTVVFGRISQLDYNAADIELTGFVNSNATTIAVETVRDNAATVAYPASTFTNNATDVIFSGWYYV